MQKKQLFFSVSYERSKYANGIIFNIKRYVDDCFILIILLRHITCDTIGPLIGSFYDRYNNVEVTKFSRNANLTIISKLYLSMKSNFNNRRKSTQKTFWCLNIFKKKQFLRK